MPTDDILNQLSQQDWNLATVRELADANSAPYHGDGAAYQAARQRIIDAFRAGQETCRNNHGACGKDAVWAVTIPGEDVASDVCLEHFIEAAQAAHDFCAQAFTVDCPQPGAVCRWAVDGT